VQDLREGVFAAINDAHACLKRLRAITEASGTYRVLRIGQLLKPSVGSLLGTVLGFFRTHHGGTAE